MNTVIDPQTAVFNQVEELVGTYPSRDGLRNAIHAVLTQGCKSLHQSTLVSAWNEHHLSMYVDEFARNYETVRGTHMHVGTSCNSLNGVFPQTCDRPIVGGVRQN